MFYRLLGTPISHLLLLFRTLLPDNYLRGVWAEDDRLSIMEGVKFFGISEARPFGNGTETSGIYLHEGPGGLSYNMKDATIRYRPSKCVRVQDFISRCIFQLTTPILNHSFAVDTITPSISPSTSQHPSTSQVPSIEPTKTLPPSQGPSSSSKPSSQPSEQPSVSVAPSQYPSMMPSENPSQSVLPSQGPSVSHWPTSQPS